MPSRTQANKVQRRRSPKNSLATLLSTNKSLREKVSELEETLRVIQNGEVDALVVTGPTGDRIFTLQSAEQPYRELVEAMNEGAVTVSPEGLILYCNSRFSAMTGVPQKKLLGSELKSYVFPEHRKNLHALLKRSRKTPSSAEVAIMAEDGATLPVQLSVSAIELVGNDGFCIIATDLSAQKRSAQVFQQQEWLGTLLNLLPIPLVLLDADLNGFTFVNAKANEIFGGLVKNFYGYRSGDQSLPFEDVDGKSVQLNELLPKFSQKIKGAGLELMLAAEGLRIPILLFAEELPAMHGREPTRLLMFQDISVIKQAQLDLSLALRGRDQFMAALSHELRTPLNIILGWVQLLRDNPGDQLVINQALDTLERNADLQRDLIEDLLDMSRIITGNLVLQLKPMDLKNSILGCVTSMQPKADEKNIEIRVQMESIAATVLADDKRIQQLIINILQNAIKFTPQHGKICVRVSIDDSNDQANIEVQDNGQGIDPLFLPHVFDQFKQENMTTNRAYGGLGLGLAICKTIVEQHEGELSVSSEGRGKGATFSVKLPLVKSQQHISARVPVMRSSGNTSFKGVKILVVDDSKDNLALFKIWLKSSGAEIKTLDSASGVIKALSTFKPDVLLSDISMPGEDGFALIAKVRALTPDQGGLIPAGAITANARSEDRDQALAAGYHLHISKPVTSNGLMQAVKALVELGKHQTANS